jgi:hypothetical protein
MLKKLTASAATGFLLLGASGVAMAQTTPPELPPMVVYSIQTTSNLTVEIAAGDPCADALKTLGAANLQLKGINIVQQNFLAFVEFRPPTDTGRAAAILVCAPEGTEVPTTPTTPTTGQ